MSIEFVEAFMMSRQGCRMLVNIFSCRGGECFRSCQIIEAAAIHKQPYGIGIEIKDDERPETAVRIGYPKLKTIRVMEIEDIILTFIYDTLHIEVLIKRS